MADPSDYYVDPSIAGNSGAGTLGDPYGDLQYALDTITINGTSGDRINIKAGTDEILSAALDLSTYGTPGAYAPLIFQGYTSAQGDGGVGVIDCSGTSLFSSAPAGVHMYDLEIHDGPSAAGLVNLGAYCNISGSYVHDADGHGVTGGEYTIISDCRIEDVGGASFDGIAGILSARVLRTYIKNGATRNMRNAIDMSQNYMIALGNIISVDSGSNGINVTAAGAIVEGNTVFASAGTGQGIYMNLLEIGCSCVNNYVEGFSGTGGNGIEYTTTNDSYCGGVYGKNACYNNATNFAFTNDHSYLLGDNETLSASGIEKSGSDTYANRFTYFAPADEGNMQTGAAPEA